MLVALAAAAAVAAPLAGCDRPLPQGPVVPAPIVLRTACGGFLLRRDGRVERRSPRWLREHRGNPPQPYADGREVGVNARGNVVVRRAGVRVWRAAGVHRGITPAFGPGGSLAFGAYGQGVYLTDLRSRERLVVREPYAWPLAFGADGHLVVRTGRGLVILRPGGSVQRRVAYRVGHGAVVDPASSRVYVVAPGAVLTAVDGAHVARLGRLAGVRGWLTAVRGGRAVFQERSAVSVWDVRGRVVARAGWPRRLGADSGLSVAPDGRSVAFRLSDARAGAAFATARIRVLDMATGRAREIYRHRFGPVGCGVGGNLWWHGRALLYGTYDGHVAVLDVDGGRPIHLTQLLRALSPAGAPGSVSASWLD